MLLAAKLALGPVLLRQARVVRRTALRLPEAAGPREGRVGAGQPKLRLLVIGDSSAAGVGLEHQSQALAQPLASILAARLGAAVAWQLVARTGASTADAQLLLSQSQVGPADVVVTALGVNDVSAQLSPGAFVTHTEQLWREVRERTGASWGVVSGLPPMQLLTAMPQPLRWYLGQCSTALDSAVKSWAQREGLGFCALRWSADPAYLAADGFHPGPALYPQWAQRLAEIILVGPLRPEPVEGPDRPERVEGPEFTSVRPELVEGPERRERVERPDLVEGPERHPPFAR